jgi:hypothetical protein
VAGPLIGVWAVAPYLHNGSVPTLRQLLVPSLRTTTAFLRGSTSYNQTDGGWEWEPSKEAELRGRGDTAIALHDLREAGFSPVGHASVDNLVLVDGRGKSVRVGWSTMRQTNASSMISSHTCFRYSPRIIEPSWHAQLVANTPRRG